MIAPSLVPVKAGARVKTDRRDAAKLARSYRAGDLTPVWVPDAAHEALRDLVRAREDARQDQHRARHRLSKFLLRHGRRPPETVKKARTLKYLTWIKEQVKFFLAQVPTMHHQMGSSVFDTRSKLSIRNRRSAKQTRNLG